MCLPHLLVPADCSGVQSSLGLVEFLATNMTKKLILNVTLKPMDKSYVLRTYKVRHVKRSGGVNCNKSHL